ncbi:MAG TPA: branched-chain amino acid ABC transporter permease/ATP-binding protein [Gordonia sp. (in: high G+C Gram-positive bacteria)]|uniref:branched-chain amino acid ABC transporter permease/ATP-binding protein n=1 Tax=unclassified Gordonia (in: high G+C Gram-positive bacteria) TaxID=2657482 RepID=UPI000FAEB95B|nr:MULTISPECIES: branched-chain amino acid ABC transporter permease/ATP-binding protein [unclassified Gordonia (in: high G+C Gram-positive bacteria)]RUP39414.1 MAG: ATP-binding cassette domain-containing protein [Gordonia sp. (in: high G+C Gram-positive bacteria)]HNP56768.1 branched-chain amino acid ABC transporter permease/ATP-binding protein [Gordonia sp. (in: high G+C Gram-positive bacteria)]HRC49891.1 branched-chain amino acid ABC transporter permease/ATP-binding protein [Gordonia sp. (in: h
MREFGLENLAFLLLGTGSGAVFGALALGIVLTYRSSGVVNFATGAIALFGAYVYAYLRQGELIVPVPGLPATVDIGTDLGFVPAALIGVAASALLGLVLYLLVFRPLRTAPMVARAVAALGVSLLIPALFVVRMGTSAMASEAIFPSTIWRIDGTPVQADRVYFAITVLLLGVVVWLFYRYSGFGLATRAAAETERGAYVSGLSPDRLAAINWVISSAVAGLAGVLITPIVPVVPIAYTLFIVPALAAAIVARFDRVIVAVVAGLAIGMLGSWVGSMASQHSVLPSSGLPEMVPLLLIVAVLVVRAKPLPARGAVILKSLGSAPRPNRVLVPAVLGAAIAVVGLLVLSERLRAGLIISIIMAVIALSIVVVTGYAGQISLAQLTIAGVAGFLVGPLARVWHLGFPWAPLLAALIAAAIGVLIGLPALRIRGLAVAVVTLAMAFAVEAVWFRNIDVVGSSGVAVVPPRLFGLDLAVGTGLEYPRVAFGVLCVVVATAVALFVAWLRRSRLGSQMLAVRANEKSAAAAGVNVVRVKVAAFGIGAFIAGLGGSLLAYQQQTVTFEAFSAMASVTFFATVYLCGATSISGGLLAGLVAANGLVYILVDESVGIGQWYPVVMSVLLILMVVLNPEGIVGPMHSWLGRRRSAAAGSAGADVLLPDVDARAAVVEDRRGDAALLLDSVGVAYGGVTAVEAVSLTVRPGTMVGLIGPNGAGKTSVIDAVSGFADYTGRVGIGATVLDGLPPHKRVGAGLSRTFQAIELYDDLSVAENVRVGLASVRGESSGDTVARLDEVLAMLGLRAHRDRPAADLSQGQRQLVSIARALASNPAILLLDEPAGGLDTTESARLGQRLVQVRDAGVGIVIVDHDMDLIFGACDYVYVVDFGKVIAEGTPDQVRTDPDVAAAYLGQKAVADD